MASDYNRSNKILKTIDGIREFIGGKDPISRDKCKELIGMGMPAFQIGAVWYAHADLVDDWFASLSEANFIQRK